MRTRGTSYQRTKEPVLLDLLEEAVYHTMHAGHVEEAWELYRSRLGGFDDLSGSPSDLARGYRIVDMFVRYFDSVDTAIGVDADGQTVRIGDNLVRARRPHRDVAWQKLEYYVRAEHERYKAVLDGTGGSS